MDVSFVDRLLQKGELAAAEQRAQRALQATPTSGEAWATMAKVQFRRGRLPTVRRLLDEAMRLGPPCPTALRLHGKVLCAEHRWHEAVAVLREAFARDATRSTLHNLAIALHMADRFGEAVEAYGRLSTMGKSDEKLRRSFDASLALVTALAERTPYRFTGSLPSAHQFLAGFELPTIEARVNGEASRLMVDTGASELILRQSFAQRIKAEAVPGGGPFSGRFAGGTSGELTYAVLHELQLGNFSLTDVPALVMGDREGEPSAYDGVLGVQFLRRFQSCFEYGRGRLVLHDANLPFTPQRDALRVPYYTLFDHYSVAYGRLEDAEEEPVFIDSGGTFGLATTTRKYRQIYGQAAPDAQRTGHSAVASIEFQEFRVKRFSLGPVVARDIDGVLGVLDEQLGDRLGFAIDLLASHNFLSRYVVTWDYRRSSLWFRDPTTAGP